MRILEDFLRKRAQALASWLVGSLTGHPINRFKPKRRLTASPPTARRPPADRPPADRPPADRHRCSEPAVRQLTAYCHFLLSIFRCCVVQILSDALFFYSVALSAHTASFKRKLPCLTAAHRSPFSLQAYRSHCRAINAQPPLPFAMRRQI